MEAAAACQLRRQTLRPGAALRRATPISSPPRRFPPLRLVCPAPGRALQSKKPVLYVGGGCLESSEEVRELVRLTGIPVAQTLMGLGAFPETDPLSLQVGGP